jgi:hypothetical protein
MEHATGNRAPTAIRISGAEFGVVDGANRPLNRSRESLNAPVTDGRPTRVADLAWAKSTVNDFSTPRRR